MNTAAVFDPNEGHHDREVARRALSGRNKAILLCHHLFLKTKHIVARLVCGCSMADASMLCAQSHRNLACAVNTRHKQKCICTLEYSAYYYDKQCTGADGALAPLVAATRCAHECMNWSVRGVTALTKAVVPLPVAEPASRQVPHALTSGKGGGGGPPPSQEGPLLARAQPEDSTPLQRALPPPLRRVERSSAVSSVADWPGHPHPPNVTPNHPRVRRRLPFPSCPDTHRP